MTKTPVPLDEFGQAIWLHKHNKNLFIERPYYWCDRIILIDETGDGRRVINETQFSTFDFSDWTPMTVEQFKKVKMQFKDIYK